MLSSNNIMYLHLTYSSKKVLSQFSLQRTSKLVSRKISQFKELKPKVSMDLITWVKMCKELLPLKKINTELTICDIWIAHFYYDHFNSYLASQYPVDVTWSFTKDLQRRWILSRLKSLFKLWIAARGNAKPISHKQLCGGLPYGMQCVCVPLCAYMCFKHTVLSH